MTFALGLKAFFGNKLVQYGLMVALIAILIMGAIHMVKGAYSDLKTNIRKEVTQEYTIKELGEALEQSRKDQEFWKAQNEKNEQAVENLRSDLSAMSSRVGSSRTIIREQIASGELPNGVLSPVKTATVQQIDIMEQERANKEAENATN